MRPEVAQRPAKVCRADLKHRPSRCCAMSSDLARALSIVRPNNLPRISILTAALHGAELYALRKRLARAQDRATEMLATLQVSQMPTREDLLAAAKAMFARTPSLDEIADRTFMNSFSHPSAGLLRLRLSIIISWSGRSYLGSSNFRLRERFDPKAPPPKTAAFWDIVDASRSPPTTPSSLTRSTISAALYHSRSARRDRAGRRSRHRETDYHRIGAAAEARRGSRF